MIFAAILILAAQAPARAGDCVAVAGDRIVAAELARAHPVFAALAADLDLLPAPVAGGRRLLKAGETVRLAQRLGLQLSPEAPRLDLCFVRQVQPLSPEAIVEALARLLPPDTEIELADYSRYPVPAGDLQFTAAPAHAASSLSNTAILWRGAVRSPGGRSTPVWARVRLSRSQKLWIARRDLAAGRPIEAADLELEVRKTSPFSAPPGNLEEITGRAPRRTIRGGDPVLPAQTVEPPEVRAGSQVEVESRNAGVRLRFPAVAETSGRTGESIWVRQAGSGNRFPAIVTGRGMAEKKQQEDSPHAGSPALDARGPVRTGRWSQVAQR